jgi:hypothetical protein
MTLVTPSVSRQATSWIDFPPLGVDYHLDDPSDVRRPAPATTVAQLGDVLLVVE